MSVFNELIGNKILVSAFCGWFVAQVLKTILYIIVNKEFNPERLMGDGGMLLHHMLFTEHLLLSLRLPEYWLLS